jgi:hypothetical protein
VVGDGLGVLERAPIFKICGDVDRTESVTARGVGQAGGQGATLDHVQHIEPRHRIVGQLVALAHAAKQRPLLVAPDAAAATQTFRNSSRLGRVPRGACRPFRAA